MSIPLGWKKVKFAQLAKEKSNRVDKPSESGFDRYVGLEHLDSGMLIVKRWGSTNDVTSAMKLFNKEDLLFARRNTYLKRVSVAQFDGVCSGDIIVIEPILDEIVKGFLPIYMQFEDFENRVISLSAGAFSKRIKWKQLAEQEILIPPKGEQKRIVELVWNVQESIEKIENIISINKKLKNGLLNSLISEDFNSKLGDHILFEKKSSRRAGEGLDDGKYTFFTSSPVQSKYINEADYEGEHLVFGTGGTASMHYYNNKFSTSADCFVITSKNMKLKYIYYHLLKNFDVLAKGFVGGALKHLSKKYLENMPIRELPVNKQETVISVLDCSMNLEHDLTSCLQKSSNLKKKLTDELLKGDLRLK